DLIAFRGGREPSLAASVACSAFYIALGVGFAGVVWGWQGGEAASASRAGYIAAGAALLDAAHWVIYLFGAFLVATAVKLARHGGVTFDAERSRIVRA